MSSTNEASLPPSQPPADPEELLTRALRAGSPKRRMRYARAGLENGDEGIAPDTQVLLLRQVYRAHLELHELQGAADVARRMAEIGPLRDIAYHDRARALYALGEPADAIAAQRKAARHAPAERRSFHLWALATLQHFSEDPTGAEASLERALRWSTRDRALLRAHFAYVQLEQGMPPADLDSTVTALRESRSAEGYGQFLLGMVAYHMGDSRGASVHLRAFLNRNTSAGAAKALTLSEELRRARRVLAELESV